MKVTNKIISTILCMLILMSVIMSAPFTVNAVTETKYKLDGIVYKEIDESTVAIVGFSRTEVPENVVVPSTVEGKTVTKIEFLGLGGAPMKTLVLPETLNTICYSAFSGCPNLESVTILGNLTGIDRGVFRDCRSLKEIDLPDSVSFFLNEAFYGCESLESFEMPLHLKVIHQGAFRGCKSLKKITINPELETIEGNPFAELTNLTEVVFEERTIPLAIEDGAFRGCTGLTSFDFTHISELGMNAFSGCTGLKSITLPALTFRQNCFKDCTGLEKVVLHSKTTQIKDSLFEGCTNLETIETGVIKVVGNNAFNNCVNLKNASFLNDNQITWIGQKAFYNCEQLTQINLKDIETILDRAFENCYNLSTVTIGDNIETVNNKAFYNCYHLKDINLQNAVKIYDQAFENCYNLSSVTIGEKLKSIGERAFFNCFSLPQIYIPNKVKSIGGLALGCFEEEGVYYGFSDFTLLGYPDSLAKDYAKAYQMKYALPAPILSKVENKTDGIKITFKKLADVTGKYRVYRKTADSSWKKLADITGSTYTDTTAQAGVEYTYTVKYIGKPANSIYDTYGLSITRLTTPSVSKIENTNDGAKLTIKAVEGAAKYRVYVRSGSSWKSLGTTDSTIFTHTGAKSGTTYKYTVKAYDVSGESVSAYNSTGFSNKFVAPPQITKLSNTETGVKITWGKVEGAEKYRVFVKSGSSWKKLKDTTSTSFTHTSAESGKTYTYTVRCISSTGKSYKSGYDTTGTSTLFLATPVVKSISNTVDGAKLTYTAIDGACKYNIYVKSGSSWKKLGESTTNTFVHESAKSGTAYTYRVRAYDETLEYSSYYKTSSSNKFISAPVISKLENTSKGVKITWGKVAGAEKYRVFVKSGSKWKKLKDTTSTSYTHTSAKSGETYTYTVRCISSSGKSYKSGYDTVGKSIVFEK